MDEMQRLDRLSGQVHSLIGFALAVIQTHPDPELLRRHLGMADLAATARVGAEPVTDEFLEGMADVSVRLKASVERAATRRA